MIFGGVGKYGPLRFDVTDKDWHSVDFASSSKNENTSSNEVSDNLTKSPEEYCSKIGYKSGTEKYADCVMKMMDKN